MFVVSEEKMNNVLNALEDCVNNLKDASGLRLAIKFDRSNAQKHMLAYISTLGSDYAVAALLEKSCFVTGFGTDNQQQMPLFTKVESFER